VALVLVRVVAEESMRLVLVLVEVEFLKGVGDRVVFFLAL
jgi:ABC-type polar amino acid transport system ATPase subunit